MKQAEAAEMLQCFAYSYGVLALGLIVWGVAGEAMGLLVLFAPNRTSSVCVCVFVRGRRWYGK
jgi:hypothetical protein